MLKEPKCKLYIKKSQFKGSLCSIYHDFDLSIFDRALRSHVCMENAILRVLS